MELLQGSEAVVAVAALELRAVGTGRLRLEHLRAHQQQAEGRRRPLPLLEELQLPIPTNYMQPAKKTS